MRTLALVLAIVALTIVACSAQPTATPTPTPTPSPTPTPTPVPRVEPSPQAQALRERAEAFAQARNEARFEDAYETFTTPSFREVCDLFGWIGGLVGEAAVLLALSGFGDDEPIDWRIELVEVANSTGTVVESATTHGGRSLGIKTRSWALADGEWWLDEPPERMCNL